MVCNHRIDIKSILKKTLFLITLTGILFLSFPYTTAEAYNRASAVVVMDADSGEVLHEENPNLRLEIASTTKILTAITTIENADIFQEVSIPKDGVGVEGSSIYLREGERWRVLDLLYGLMLRSGNDAAITLALITSGSIDNFTKLMNATAEKAGTTNSHFTNPHGLHDEHHYSTAFDLAKITSYALLCPIFAEICKTKTHFYTKKNGVITEKGVFYNKNKMLYSYSGANGVKTGYTRHSGRCLVSSATRDGRTLICVVINVYDTYGVTKSLFDRYFQ